MKHKLHLFSLLLLTVAFLMPTKLMAQVVINNITYTFSGTEATVTNISPLPANLVIPSTVTYNGVTYNVTTLNNFYTGSDDHTLTSITAPSIKKIIGDNYSTYFLLLTSQQELTSISFPALETIGGFNVFNQLNKLTTLSLPSLTTIESNAWQCISDLPVLTTLSLPELITLDGYSTLDNVKKLHTIHLPKVQTIAGTWTLRSCSISELDLPANCSVTAMGMFTWPDPSVTSFTVRGLKKLDGAFFIGHGGNTLKHISFPDLEEYTGGPIGANSEALESFSAPKLRKIKNSQFFSMGSCPNLTTVDIPNLVEIENSQLFNDSPIPSLSLRGDLKADAGSSITLNTYPTLITITDEATANDIPASFFANVMGGRFIAPKGKAGMYATKWNLNTAKTMVYSPVEINKSTASTLYASGSITKADASFTYGGTTYKNQYDMSHAMTAAECLDPSVLSANDYGFTPTLATQTVQNGTDALAGFSFYYASAYADTPTRKVGDLTLSALSTTTAANTLQGFNATATSLNQGIGRDLGGFLFKGNNAAVTEVYLPYTPTATTVTTNYLKAGEGTPVKSRQNNTYDFYWHPGNASFTMGFYESENVVVPEYRAYLSFAKTMTANAKQFRLIFEDGETTGINTVNMSADDNSATSSDAWYTPQGTRLPAKPTAAGIYINGGRKVVIK